MRSRKKKKKILLLLSSLLFLLSYCMLAAGRGAKKYFVRPIVLHCVSVVPFNFS
jgi:hypothetical protein